MLVLLPLTIVDFLGRHKMGDHGQTEMLDSSPLSRFLEATEQQGKEARQTQFAKGRVQSLKGMPEVSNLDAHSA